MGAIDAFAVSPAALAPAPAPAAFGVVEVFDPTAGLWTTLPSMSTPRGGCAAAVSCGRIYVVGGSSRPGGGHTAHDDVECLDLESGRWSRSRALPNSCASCVGAAIRR